MTNALAVKEVNFYGDILMAAQEKNSNVIYVGIKWVCEGIGLTEDQMKNERRKIQSDLVLSKGGSNLALLTKGGNQEVLCLLLDFVPLWLAKISITPNMKKERPTVVEKLINYQLKVKDVLAEAFLPTYRNPNDANIVFMESVINQFKQQENINNRLSTDIEQIKENLIPYKPLTTKRKLAWEKTIKELFEQYTDNDKVAAIQKSLNIVATWYLNDIRQYIRDIMTGHKKDSTMLFEVCKYFVCNYYPNLYKRM